MGHEMSSGLQTVTKSLPAWGQDIHLPQALHLGACLGWDSSSQAALWSPNVSAILSPLSTPAVFTELAGTSPGQ